MDLHVDGALPPSDLHGLVRELAAGADADGGKEALHVLRIQTGTAVAHLHTDAPRDVRPVDRVAGQRELEPVFPERVVRVAAADERARVAALADVLLPDRLGDVPLRVDGLAAHGEPPARGPAVVAPEADRIRLDGDSRRVVGLPAVQEE